MMGPQDVLHMQRLAEAVHVEEEIFDYVLALTLHTRRHRRVYLGASPRASLALLQAAKARALVKGRDFAIPDDVKQMAPSVLAHRLVLTPESELEGASADVVVQEALTEVQYRKRK